MKKYPVILDLETKFTFRQFSKHKDLGISVMVVYDYATDKYVTAFENDLSQLFPLIENASYLIGFNIKSFDMQVFQSYYPGDVSKFAVFDICDDIKDRIGRRLALNDLLLATLDKRKTGHGLVAVDLYKQNKLDELAEYCLNDVRLTKELFDHGVNGSKIFYLDSKGKKEIVLDWKKYLDDSNHRDTHLTLPFS